MYSQTYGKQKASKNAKLKFYCQMCRKQCLDDDGFRCHTSSDHHMSMMRKYHENPEYYMELFSQDFQTAFLTVLKDKFKFAKVSGNEVYTELIKNVDHVHLNGTKWTLLNEFLYDIGQQGIVKYEKINDHDGYVQMIDKSLAAIKKKKELDKKNKATKKQLIDKHIQLQVDKNNNQEDLNHDNQEENQELQEIQGPISFELNIKPKNDSQLPILDIQEERKVWIDPKLEKPPKKIDNLYQKLKYQNEKQGISLADVTSQEKDDAWIIKNIVVKIKDDKLQDGKFLDKKGWIKEVEGDYIAIVEIIGSKKQTILIDQKNLETVIPKIGGKVIILNGVHRGKIGKLESVHQDNFSGSVYIENEDLCLEAPYEDFSKLNE
ncbi:hypothetical protein pb186bvf_014143 [Paramecium bursaria]